MTSAARQAVGRLGEDYAAQQLAARGCAVLARNWRCAAGEIDIVAERDGVLIFVEVRTRRGDRFGTPEESITPRKRAHLIAAAQAYLDEHDAADRDWRIDLAAIELDRRGSISRFELIENAVEE